MGGNHLCISEGIVRFLPGYARVLDAYMEHKVISVTDAIRRPHLIVFPYQLTVAHTHTFF